MQTAINREVLVEVLRREVSKTPSGIAMDLVTARQAARGSSSPLVFLVSKEWDTTEAREFLESICSGMGFERSKVEFVNETTQASNFARYMVCFGASTSLPNANVEIVETLAPLELKSNVNEKKRLWAQLKVWARELSRPI